MFFGTDIGGAWRPLNPDAVPAYLGGLCGLPPGVADSLAQPTVEVSPAGRPVSEWLPSTDSLRVPAKLECALPPAPALWSDAAEFVLINGCRGPECE